MAILNQRYIETLKHDPEKQIRSRAESGLKLLLGKKPSTLKSWELTYYIHGVKRRFVFGAYPIDFTLATARVERDRLKSLVKKGVCPKEQAKRELQARALENAQRITMRGLRERFDKEHLIKNGITSRVEMLRVLEDKFGCWDNYEPRELNRLLIVERLDSIEKSGPVIRNRAHSYLSSQLSFGVEKSILDVNLAKGISKLKEFSRRVVLTDDDIRAVWQEIDSHCGKAIEIALKLILVTGQRGGEVLSMRPDDLNNQWWTQRSSKNGRQHRTYLTPLALELVAEAKDCSTNSIYIFGSGKHNHIKTQPLAKAVSRWRDRTETPVSSFTPHDLRRTMATGLGRMGVDRFAQNQILNHVDHSIGGVYDVGEYDDLKKKAMLRWESHLLEIINGQSDSPESLTKTNNS